MVLAYKESTYVNEQIQKEQGLQSYKKRQKSYKFEKIVITIIATIVFVCSMLILTRFTAVTEARYNINNLEKQLERMKIEKTKLKVEVEKVSKSGWIEDEAKTRLEMNYPIPEQIIRININPAKVAILTNEMNKSKNNNFNKQKEAGNLYTFLGKLINYIRI